MAERAASPVPEGMNTLTVQLWFGGDCREAIAHYQEAFGAERCGPAVSGPDGKSVMHVMLKIGSSHVMMADAWPGYEKAPAEATTASLWVYTEDCDALYERAVAAGCEVMFPMMDAFWGDRLAKVKDRFGHVWAIASHQWDYTPEEIAEGQAAWLASLGG